MNQPNKSLRIIAVVLTVLASASCSADSDIKDRAELIAAKAQGTVVSVDPSEECTTETIIDEYGFEIEITECGDTDLDIPVETTS